MTDGNTWINGQAKAIKKILPVGGTATLTEIVNPAGTAKLTGEITFKDFLDLEEINLDENELTKVTFINCPKLKIISVSNNRDGGNNPLLEVLNIEKLKTDNSGKPIANVLEELECGGNKIERIDFTYCEEMTKFECPSNPSLDRIENLDKCKKIEVINMDQSGPVRVMNEVKQAAFKAVADEVKDIFGKDSLGELPMEEYTDDKGRKQQRIKKGALKTQLMDKVVGVKNPQLKTDKENAEKERDEAKNDLSNLLTEIVNGAGLGLTGSDITKDKIIAKIREIRQQVVQATNSLLNKVNDLGLGLTGDSITEDKVLEKIRDLINKPTTSCTHTDYDAIKAERDRLKNENKENQNKNSVQKEVLVENIENKFSGWGITDSKYKEELKNASASEVEELRNKLIDKRFSELGKEKKTALALNITLGVLTIGSLLVLGWLLMREANPPKVEPGQDKKEKK